VQMECNQDIRFNSTARKIFADSLARVIVEYMGSHYFSDFATNACLPVCVDSYEPNNTGSIAVSVPLSTDVKGKIDPSIDIDWFKFKNTVSQPNIKITLTDLPADYNLTLTKSGTLATSKKTGTNPETIIWNTATTGTYKVKVFGKNGAFNATQCYSLKIDLSSTPWPAKSGSEIEPEEFSAQEVITAFPVPASNILNVQYKGDDEITGTLKMVNLMGQLVYSEPVHFESEQQVELNVTKLPAGNYLLGLLSEEGNWNVIRISIIH
ncbi:MAG: T9SS type A sorting domain-containing protein, partial [Chitinophagales bacterium]